MPAATLRAKLTEAIGGRPLNFFTAQMPDVRYQQLKNLVDGTTEPWDVRVRTAQQIIEMFPFHLTIQDFYKGRSTQVAS